jgi:prevent-host-death family protein
MKTVGSRELKNRLGRYLGRVRKGETFVVTDRGKPVARLLPAATEEERPNTVEDVLRRLEAEGHVRRAKGSFKGRTFKPIVTRGKPVSRMIIEDRE